jgi:hypothetical protein
MLLPKGVQTFLYIFFPFATCANDTGGAAWATNISENFIKIRNGILRGLEKLIHEKNLMSKISWHCPFKQMFTITVIPIIMVTYLRVRL